MRNGRKRLTQICGAKNRQGLACQCKLLLNGGLNCDPAEREAWVLVSTRYRLH